MSKGSPRVTVRLSKELLDQIAADMAIGIAHDAQCMDDLSDWIQEAIRQRLVNRARCRARRRPRKLPGEGNWPNEVVSLTDPQVRD